MGTYRNILAAVDLHTNCDNTLLKRAKALSDAWQASLSVIHEVKHINAYGVSIGLSCIH